MEPIQQKGMVVTDYDPRRLANAGAWLVLLDHNGVPSPARIRLLGADSDEYEDEFRRQQRQQAKEIERTRKIKVSSPEAQLEGAITLMIVCTAEWEGLLDSDGKAIPCAPQNARDLYLKRKDIREQVDAFINDRSNFLPSAAKP